tara:strand:- start:279 stop:920 length:642 start_codon:yes stop_codon:yes gene_type:complete
MVLPKYRGIGVFSKLLSKVRSKELNNTPFVIMWPNKQNFASFGLKKYNIKKRHYFLYQNNIKKKSKNILKKNSIENLDKIKSFIKRDYNSFFYKNYEYFKHRYFDYKKNDYFINEFNYKNSNSFFILKKLKKRTDLKFVIMDHFGSREIINRHFLNLFKNCNKLVFLTKKKVQHENYKFLNSINFYVGINKKLNFKINKDIYLGDTDIFITLK